MLVFRLQTVGALSTLATYLHLLALALVCDVLDADLDTLASEPGYVSISSRSQMKSCRALVHFAADVFQATVDCALRLGGVLLQQNRSD
jgi:hypothetical protein